MKPRFCKRNAKSGCNKHQKTEMCSSLFMVFHKTRPNQSRGEPLHRFDRMAGQSTNLDSLSSNCKRREWGSRLVGACQTDLDSFEAEQLKKAYPGIKRPKLRLDSFKIGTCDVQLGDDDAYNDHMRNLHGVTTTVSSKKHKSGIYPSLDTTPKSNGVEKVLNELVPTLKTISAAGGKHIPMNRLKAKPGRKEVEWQDFILYFMTFDEKFTPT